LTVSDASHEPLDEWLRRDLIEEFGPEKEPVPWAADKVSRIMKRLSAVRTAGSPRLEAEILWVREVTAFTLPGHYVYISRRLLERCASDEPVAFALAHEVAHHDLGHLHGLDSWAAAMPRELPSFAHGRAALMTAIFFIERRVHGPEHELAADARALEMCTAAGYNGEHCLQLFDVLESDALDKGDLDGVYGLEDALDPASHGAMGWLTEAREWAFERLRGYVPIRERKARLRQPLRR
jgi:predicted Zn-dependent protease